MSGEIGDCSVCGVYPGMPEGMAFNILTGQGMTYLAFTEDGWFVFSDNAGKLLAYKRSEYDALETVYAALEGYLGIAY